MLHFTEFVASSVAIILLPGPGQLAILTATLSGGFRSGLKAVAGLLTGDLVIMTLTALGIATVMEMAPNLMQVLRWAGGLYICWIGGKTFLSSLSYLTATSDLQNRTAWYFRTVGITLLNPKAVLFFLSFFPLFMDPTQGVARSYLQMGALFTAMSGSYLVLFAWMGSKFFGRIQSSPAAAVWVPRGLGTVIACLGLRLLWT